jgi:hypothetical protein
MFQQMSYHFDVNTSAKPRTCAVITSNHAYDSNSGANIRVRAVVSILNSMGFEVEILTKEKLRLIQTKKKYDLGVLVSFSQIKSFFFLRKLASNIWLDSTDSLIGTRLLGLGRYRIFSYVNGLLEILLAILLRRQFLCVTYISKRDMKFDRFLFRNTPKFIFPNNKIERPRPDYSSKEVAIYFVGDISYNANRNAIKFIETQMSKVLLQSKGGVTVVSNMENNNRKVFLPNGNLITYEQDVPAARLYGENTIHIVPIWNAVGIKNKVLEPASLGLRVLAASPSFNGLILYDHMIPVLRKSEFIPKLNTLLTQDIQARDITHSIIETDQTFEFVKFLHNFFKKTN